MHAQRSLDWADATVAVGRAVRVLVLVGLATVPVAVAYGVYYDLAPHLQRLYPSVSPTAAELSRGFFVSVFLLVGWCIVLNMAVRRRAAIAVERLGEWARRDEAAALALVVSLLLAGTYAVVRLTTNEWRFPAPLEELANGTAGLPFQYRALVPLLARAALSVFPGLTAPAAFGLLEAASALAAYGAFAVFLGLFFRERHARLWLALVVFLPLFFNLALPFRYNSLYFASDTASVAFFAAGLYLVHRRAWTWYYPLFIFATLNRETACFLTICYALAYWKRDGLARTGQHVLMQAGLWFAVKVALFLAYRGNGTIDSSGAGFFFVQVSRSVDVLTSPVGWLYFPVALGGMWLVPLVLWRFVDEPALRRTFYVVPVFLTGMFFVGELMEVRIYSELIPMVAAATLLVLRSLLRSMNHQESLISSRALRMRRQVALHESYA